MAFTNFHTSNAFGGYHSALGNFKSTSSGSSTRGAPKQSALAMRRLAELLRGVGVGSLAIWPHRSGIGTRHIDLDGYDDVVFANPCLDSSCVTGSVLVFRGSSAGVATTTTTTLTNPGTGSEFGCRTILARRRDV